MSASVLTDVLDEVAVVTLHRPEASNALDGPTIAALRSTRSELDGRDDVAAVVLTLPSAPGLTCVPPRVGMPQCSTPSVPLGARSLLWQCRSSAPTEALAGQEQVSAIQVDPCSHR